MAMQFQEHVSKCECRIASLQAHSRSQSSPQGQTSSLPAQPDPVPQIPDSLANETLYKKRKEGGTILFIPVHVGGQSVSSTGNQVGNRISVEGNRELPGDIESASSVATPGGSNSDRGDQQHTRNQVHTPDTGGDHPAQASPKDGNPNLFGQPAAKDYSKGSMKSDTTLKQHILNNAVAGQSSSQQLTPRSSGEQPPAKVAPPNGKSAAKLTEPSSSLEAGLDSPASGSADEGERPRVLLILKATEKRMTMKDISESVGKEVEEVTAILMQLFQRGKVSRGTDEKGNECWTIILQASGR